MFTTLILTIVNLIQKPSNVSFLTILVHKKNYKCYYPSSKRFIVSYDVTFFEHQSFYLNNSLQGDKSSEENHWDPYISLPISLYFSTPNFFFALFYLGKRSRGKTETRIGRHEQTLSSSSKPSIGTRGSSTTRR